MSVHLTMCRLCTQSRPDFYRTIIQLLRDHPDLEVMELDCMAACDDVPALMIGYDYYPQLSPCELRAVVLAALNEQERAHGA